MSSPEAGRAAAAPWQRRAVRVRVPATSANLGPGFDTLGLALTLHDEVEAEVTDAGLTIEVSGEGSETEAAGERHLVVRAMRAGFAAAGGQPPGLALRCRNAIPHGRGLGSSAAAVVAGLLAARALASRALAPGVTSAALTDGKLLALATAMEGHPDNAAACLAGGLTIAWQGGEGPRLIRLEPLPAIVPVACVPGFSVATAAARRALPATVPHADAAANAGRAALLVAALTHAPDLLLDATRDLLHEPYRAPLMPDAAGLIGRLRRAGIAAVLSGAGPSVLALTVRGQAPGPDEVDSIVSQAGKQWHVTPLDVDRQGAAIGSAPPGARHRNGQAGRSSPGCWSPRDNTDGSEE